MKMYNEYDGVFIIHAVVVTKEHCHFRTFHCLASTTTLPPQIVKVMGIIMSCNMCSTYLHLFSGSGLSASGKRQSYCNL
jgi:hypothetical protein